MSQSVISIRQTGKSDRWWNKYFAISEYRATPYAKQPQRKRWTLHQDHQVIKGKYLTSSMKEAAHEWAEKLGCDVNIAIRHNDPVPTTNQVEINEE